MAHYSSRSISRPGIIFLERWQSSLHIHTGLTSLGLNLTKLRASRRRKDKWLSPPPRPESLPLLKEGRGIDQKSRDWGERVEGLQASLLGTIWFPMGTSPCHGPLAIFLSGEGKDTLFSDKFFRGCPTHMMFIAILSSCIFWHSSWGRVYWFIQVSLSGSRTVGKRNEGQGYSPYHIYSCDQPLFCEYINTREYLWQVSDIPSFLESPVQYLCVRAVDSEHYVSLTSDIIRSIILSLACIT